MATDYTILFNRLGKIFQFAKEVRAFQTTTMDTNFADVMGEYSDDTRDLVSSLTSRIDQRKRDAGRVTHDLFDDAKKTLLRMFDDDTTLERYGVPQAIDALIRRLDSASQTIDRPASGYVTLPAGNKGTAAAGNSGNGILLLSDLAPLRFMDALEILDFPSIKTETVRLRCLRDRNTRGIQSGAELFSAYGHRATDHLDPEWPKGSNTKGVLNSTRPEARGGSSPGVTAVTNGDFEQWTSNTPKNWTVVTGSPGTHFASNASAHRGSYAIRFVGDGSTAPNLTQQTNSVLGTRGRIQPDRPYAIVFAAKYATLAPGATFTVSVRDSGGTILSNGVVARQMSCNALSSDLTTSYQLFSQVVFSPVQVPTDAVIDIRFTSAPANTSEVFIDSIIVAEMKRFRPGGLAYLLAPGSTDFAVADEFTASIVNNCTTGDGEIALEMDRFFDMEELGMVLPSSTSPTLADATFIS